MYCIKQTIDTKKKVQRDALSSLICSCSLNIQRVDSFAFPSVRKYIAGVQMHSTGISQCFIKIMRGGVGGGGGGCGCVCVCVCGND